MTRTHAVLAGALFSLAALALLSPEARPCTTLIAGRNTTVDGSILYVKTEDDTPRDVDFLWYVPRRAHAPGSVVLCHAGGTVPEVAETYAYFWDEPPGTPYSSALVNEWGLALGSNACPSREDGVEAVAARGDLVDGGLGFELRFILAERCRTAREAVELAAELLDAYGYNASGRNLNIVGPYEAWQLQMVRGKQYVARRVQDDEVAVIANTYNIREVDPQDRANFVCSPRLIEYAVERGWYDPASGEPFDFAAAYADLDGHTDPGNTDRHWDMCRLLDAQFPITQEEARTGVLPVSVKPDRKLSVADVAAIFRDHYEGLGPDPGGNVSPHERSDLRPICCSTTHRVTIVQERDWMPVEIGTVVWRLLDRPCLSSYVPWYLGATRIPEPFRRAPESFYETDKDRLDYHFGMPPETWGFDPESATSVFKLLGTIVDSDYAGLHGAVRDRWEAFEEKEFAMQSEVEGAALDLYDEDPGLAKEFLNLYTGGLALESLEIAKKLLDEHGRTQTDTDGHRNTD